MDALPYTTLRASVAPLPTCITFFSPLRIYAPLISFHGHGPIWWPVLKGIACCEDTKPAARNKFTGLQVGTGRYFQARIGLACLESTDLKLDFSLSKQLKREYTTGQQEWWVNGAYGL